MTAKLNPEKLINELNLKKDELFEYLETHTIKECIRVFNLKTINRFNCIVNYWGGYSTPADKKRLICIENGKKSIDTPEKIEMSRLNGSRGYELLEDVLKRVDFEEFVNDYNLPMTKKQLRIKYNCTCKMIDKIINYYNLKVPKDNFSKLVRNSKTQEVIERQKLNYKNTMLLKYGVDNYFKTKEFKDNLKEYNLFKYGTEYYCQSEDFRKKFKCAFKSYYCDNEHFDSSWELMLWVYARDHNQKIKREPIRLNYWHNGIEHTYYPDFMYENNLIEIKGDHMLDENKKLKSIYDINNQDLLDSKQKCIDDNGVIIWSSDDLKEIFKYFKTNYNLEDFKTKNV